MLIYYFNTYYIALISAVRIFTNVKTADAYQNLFEELFCCIERDTGETFNFYYTYIIADQHKRQALVS